MQSMCCGRIFIKWELYMQSMCRGKIFIKWKLYMQSMCRRKILCCIVFGLHRLRCWRILFDIWHHFMLLLSRKIYVSDWFDISKQL